MDKRFLIFFISITFLCDSNQNRIGYGTFNLGEDKNGTNWMYISSNYTLIFDKVYTSTSGFNLYFPFVLIEAYHIPNLTLILKNENNIVVNNIGDLFGVHAFNFRGNKETKFIIQGDGKLIINFIVDNENYDTSCGLLVSQSSLIIKENAKIEITMKYPGDLIGLHIFNGDLFMEGNSQISVYLGNEEGRLKGIKCENIFLSGNVTINSSILSKEESNVEWIYPYSSIRLSNDTNVTFISNGTMTLPDEFFSYIGDAPIIINANKTLEDLKKSHKLTQLNESEPIILSNYFIEKNNENNNSQFIRIALFIFLNLILIL